MEAITLTIPIAPRTKKNHTMIAGSGPKCPTCHRALRQFVRQGKAQDAYQSEAKAFLKGILKPHIDFPVNVRYYFYMDAHRRVDLTNLTQAADDILVASGFFTDDCADVIAAHDGSRVRYDKENPRTEVCITEVIDNG